MHLQNNKTDETKQAQSVYIKNYLGIYTTLKADHLDCFVARFEK